MKFWAISSENLYMRLIEIPTTGVSNFFFHITLFVSDMYDVQKECFGVHFYNMLWIRIIYVCICIFIEIYI